MKKRIVAFLLTLAMLVGLVPQMMLAALADELRDLRVVQIDFQFVRPLFSGDAGEEQQLARSAVVNALELLARADGPVAGIRFNAEFIFQLLQLLV